MGDDSFLIETNVLLMCSAIFGILPQIEIIRWKLPRTANVMEAFLLERHIPGLYLMLLMFLVVCEPKGGQNC